MGAGQSSSASSTKHVFSSDTPVQFSQELIDSLQASSETNSTRTKSLNLHIAQRVAAELEKIQSRESKRLADIQSELAAPSDAKSADKQKSSEAVATEIENLKKKLSERKILKDLPTEVEKARGEVVGCLRLNDRRPLDCWREVEAFKREVGRLEEKFVGGVL